MSKIVLSAVCLLLMARQASAGPILNGSFENGLSGWELSRIYWGVTEFTPLFGLAPAGHQQIVDVTQIRVPSGRHDWNAPSGGRAPISGNRYAAIGTGHADYIPGINPSTFDVYIQQSLTLSQGDTLAGSSFFFNGDFFPQDTAYVAILDESGALEAVAWQQASGTLPFLASSPWTQWTWDAPTAGNYTLRLGATSLGDDYFDSWGFHDSIQVPEPSSVLLLALGASALAGTRRQMRRRRDRIQ